MQIIYMLLIMLKVVCWGERQNINDTISEVISVPGTCALILCPFTGSGSDNLTEGWWSKCSDDECQTCKGETEQNGDSGNSQNTTCTWSIDPITKGDAGCYLSYRLNFSYSSVKIIIKEKPVISILNLSDETVTLNCSAPNPCPGTHPNMTLSVKDAEQNITVWRNDNATENLIQSNGSLTLTVTFTPLFQSDAEVVCVVHYGNNASINTTKTLAYLKHPRIMGNVTLKEGATLHLNCSADSYPSFLNFSWDFKANAEHQDKSKNTLIITNVSRVHAGEYKCTVKLFKKTLTTSVNVTVIHLPRLLETHCVQRDEDLVCTCTCYGVPLPHIIWPRCLILSSQQHLIQGHVNRFTMNSTIILHRPEPPLQKVKCMCENDEGTDNKTLDFKQEVNIPKGTNINNNLKVGLRTILIFLVGAASTAVIVSIVLCFVGICKRCGITKTKNKNTKKEDVSLEAVKMQHDQSNEDHMEADEHDALQRQPSTEAIFAVNMGTEDEDTPGENRHSRQCEAAGKDKTDVDYACIDYSRLQNRGPTDQITEGGETEYAEIQIKNKAEQEENEFQEDGVDQSVASEQENGV